MRKFFSFLFCFVFSFYRPIENMIFVVLQELLYRTEDNHYYWNYVRNRLCKSLKFAKIAHVFSRFGASAGNLGRYFIIYVNMFSKKVI